MTQKVVEALAKAAQRGMGGAGERKCNRVTGDVYALSRREGQSWKSNLIRKVLNTKFKTFILYAKGKFLVG